MVHEWKFNYICCWLQSGNSMLLPLFTPQIWLRTNFKLPKQRWKCGCVSIYGYVFPSFWLHKIFRIQFWEMLVKIYIDRCNVVFLWKFALNECVRMCVFDTSIYVLCTVYRTNHKHYLVNERHQKRQKWQPHRRNKGWIFVFVFSPQHAININEANGIRKAWISVWFSKTLWNTNTKHTQKKYWQFKGSEKKSQNFIARIFFCRFAMVVRKARIINKRNIKESNTQTHTQRIKLGSEWQQIECSRCCFLYARVFFSFHQQNIHHTSNWCLNSMRCMFMSNAIYNTMNRSFFQTELRFAYTTKISHTNNIRNCVVLNKFMEFSWFWDFSIVPIRSVRQKNDQTPDNLWCLEWMFFVDFT